MNRRLLTVLEVALAVLASAFLAIQAPVGGDYAKSCPIEVCDDPAQAINGLAHGHISALWHLQPVAGPLSVLVRAPFAAIAQHSVQDQYQLGVFACMLAFCGLAIWAAHRALSGGAHPALCAAFVAGLVFNPLMFRAIALGHPEEPVAAMLVVVALLLATDKRPVAAGVTLGLAIATKQWAVLAIGPLLLAAAPQAWRPAVLALAATALLLFAPLVAGDFSRFRAAQKEGAAPSALPTPTNIWWPIDRKVVTNAAGQQVRKVPGAVRSLSRWLIVAIAAGASAFALATRKRDSLGLALSLAALIFLLRCLLDPYTFSYHHWPFLAAAAAYGVVWRRGIPIVATIATVCLWYLSYRLVQTHFATTALTRFYLAWTLPLAAALGWSVSREYRSARAS